MGAIAIATGGIVIPKTHQVLQSAIALLHHFFEDGNIAIAKLCQKLIWRLLVVVNEIDPLQLTHHRWAFAVIELLMECPGKVKIRKTAAKADIPKLTPVAIARLFTAQQTPLIDGIPTCSAQLVSPLGICNHQFFIGINVKDPLPACMG
ncbi:hypothetical protein JW907_02275 [Thermosynechococcus sp. TA-1]|nr:hypothetical protein [Thermosynechococcus sp. TA-1]QSF49627.1 hypothetical protein JW907_02275 [Thermosynechococcus sp. TA-1]